MNRLTLINALTNEKKLNNYLEIGVANGHVFFRVKSSFKVAVDPHFAFDATRKLGKIFVNPYNLFNRYFETTSDAFFSSAAPSVFAAKKIQLALVDGMHEYAFAKRDIENTVRYLSGDGVILVHDCNPQTMEEAGTFEEWRKKGSGQWNGDVWKAILHLRSMRSDLNVFVLDCDQGLGVVTKTKPENMLSFTGEQIQDFTYDDFVANREKWLNLKPAAYAYDFFGIKNG